MRRLVVVIAFATGCPEEPEPASAGDPPPCKPSEVCPVDAPQDPPPPLTQKP